VLIVYDIFGYKRRRVKNQQQRESIILSRFVGFLRRFGNMTIDTTRQIAEMPIFSLSGVDCLQGNGLKYVFCKVLNNRYNVFQSGVDLGAETLSG
jgi:hypothetical protein